jgi:hypothetical protein
MKRKEAVAAFVLVLMMAAVFASCGTLPAPGARASKSEDTLTTLEHKGTSFDLPTPPWLIAYIQSQIPGVEALPEYQGKYCIVADEMATGDGTAVLQQLLTWVNNFNAQQQIAEQISTRVASVFKAQESKVPTGEEARRQYQNAINTLVNATYSGARKEGDWWLKQRVEERGKDPEIRYQAYVLYSIGKDLLDDQVMSSVEKLKKENPGLDAAFDAVTATILEKGIDWTPDNS